MTIYNEYEDMSMYNLPYVWRDFSVELTLYLKEFICTTDHIQCMWRDFSLQLAICIKRFLCTFGYMYQEFSLYNWPHVSSDFSPQLAICIKSKFSGHLTLCMKRFPSTICPMYEEISLYNWPNMWRDFLYNWLYVSSGFYVQLVMYKYSKKFLWAIGHMYQ